MSLSLTDLFDKRSDSVFRNMVASACWRHAKTLLAKMTPTTEELKLANKLLNDKGTGPTIEMFATAAAVLIDDGTVDDAAIQIAVTTIADKLVTILGV